MPKAGPVLFAFVLDKLPNEPVAKRAEIYRALAQFTASNEERRQFEKLAADCDAIINAHDQLVLDFRRKARG